MPDAPPAPQHCPSPRELDDLELLVGGALPVDRFDVPGSPVTLSLPADVAAAAEAAGAVELVDPEGLPLARVATDGTVTALGRPAYGPFRRLHLTPAEVREQHAGRTVVPVVDALTTSQLDALRSLGRPLLLLALSGHGTPELSPVALLRASLAAGQQLPDAVVVAAPLASHGDADADHELGVAVTAAYAGPDPVHALPEAGDDDEYDDAVAAVVEADRPEADQQGLVLFFTGLSGSGKSTLARALMDRILEQGLRTVTSLDGDVVRRNLSAGLTFSKADRETNIRRIGWVAAEIARHGGLAVCSPIAPFTETRAQVRQMVEDAGGAFFLVHVATPLEECERRDRKGLYAKARRGEIPEFTGISSPYEEPDDAAVRVDTTGRSIEDALDDVVVALREAGYLDLSDGGLETGLRPSSTSGRTMVEEGRSPVSRPEATSDRPLKLLFVCTANICRSPYMETRARALAGNAPLEISSAGTHGWDAKPLEQLMSAELASRGLDGSAFRSRPLTREMVEDTDLVLTAEAAHRTFILEEHPEAFRKVFTLGQFAAYVEHADAATGRELLAGAAAHRGSASPDLDVADPYGRGGDAAATAAADIDRLLAVVVPALTRSAPTRTGQPA